MITSQSWKPVNQIFPPQATPKNPWEKRVGCHPSHPHSRGWSTTTPRIAGDLGSHGYCLSWCFTGAGWGRYSFRKKSQWYIAFLGSIYRSRYHEKSSWGILYQEMAAVWIVFTVSMKVMSNMLWSWHETPILLECQNHLRQHPKWASFRIQHKR